MKITWVSIKLNMRCHWHWHQALHELASLRLSVGNWFHSMISFVVSRQADNVKFWGLESLPSKYPLMTWLPVQYWKYMAVTGWTTIQNTWYSENKHRCCCLLVYVSWKINSFNEMFSIHNWKYTDSRHENTLPAGSVFSAVNGMMMSRRADKTVQLLA